MLEVYTWEPNANSGKPLLCLHEKRVAFTHHYIDMGKLEQFSDAFLAVNPDGTIPAIVHDGFVMTESTPAMEYIDDAFEGPSLRPATPAARHRMRKVMQYMDNVVAPSLAMIASNRLAAPRFAVMADEDKQRELARIPLPERRASWEKLMYDKTPQVDLEESGRRIADSFLVFEKMLDEADYLAGGSFSLADIDVMATYYHLPQSYPEDINERKTPNILGWLRRCHARPGMQCGFGTGRGFITKRARDVREMLGVAEIA